MAIYNTYFSVLGLQDSLGVLPNLGVLPGLGRLDDLGEYAFSPASLFLNGEQGVWYDPSDLTPEKVSWRRNLLTYSQDFENAAWTKSNASILSNLALYSQDFDNAYWVKQSTTVTANNATAPDGTTTADTLTGIATFTSYINTGSIAASASTTYTVSAYVKAGTAAVTTLRVFDGGIVNSIARANVNWSGGVASLGTVTGWSSTPTLIDVGSGWYRIVGTFSTGIYTTLSVLYYPDGNSVGANSLLWGAQLVPGSTAQTYTRSLATAAPIQFADPLGGTLADKLVENTATSTHQLFQNYQASAAGGPVTFSFFVKSAERTVAILLEPNGIERTYNLSTGVATGAGASMIDFGNGWWRCIASSTFIDTAIRSYAVRLSNGTSTTYTGDGVSGIYVYGAQVEQASTASAYQRITDFSSDFLAAFPTHALYQESTGVTPVTALGQSVGYVFDKRLGPMGDNLFGYSSWQTIGGWEATTNATLSVSNGQLVVHATGINASSGYRLTTVVGKQYQFRVRLAQDAMTGNSFMGVGSGGGSGWAANIASLNLGSTPGTYSITFTATSTDTRLSLFGSSSSVAGEILAWAEPMVREVPGNHAIQATSAARPTLQARSNLLTYSEQFDNAAWQKLQATITANTTTAPDGTTTADKVVETAAAGVHYVYQAPALAATAYTFSVYAKAAERSIVNLNAFVSPTNYLAYFNLSNGTVGTTLNCTANITNVGSGWYRCSMTFTSLAGASDIGVRPCIVDGNTSYTGDGTSGLFVWGAQLELGSAATTYQRVTTATDYADVGLPRNLTFDGVDDSLATAGNVDFATWTVGTRRNLLTVPTMFDDAAWAVTGLTRTANTIVAPDGTQTGDTITGNSATNAVIFPNAGVSASATNYTFSVYLNLGTASFAVVSLWSGSGTNGVNVWVNGSTGALTGSTNTTAGYTLVSSSSTAVGGGWYRIAVTGTLPAATVYVSVRLVDSDNAFVYTNTSGKTLNLWGAQLEVGSTATAFQDVGTDKVTLFSGVFKPSDDATRVIAELSVDKNSNNGVFFLNTEAAPRWYFESKGTLASSTNSGAVTTFAAPVTSVVTGLGDIGGDSSIIRVNGAQLGSNATNQGTGNYGSYVLYIGRRASLSLPFNGRLFQLVIRGAATDSVTVGNAERWVGQLTGVAL